KLIVSSAGISTSNHTINFENHGFNDGELVVYSPDNFFSSRNPIPLGWVAVNLSYAWSDLMNEYAIYPSDTLSLSGVNHTVYWDIEVVKEGNYTLKLQADNSSTLSIDGIQVASSTNFSPGGETNVIVTLNKGYHQISGVVYNITNYGGVGWASNPAGIAWTLEYEPQSLISDLSTSNQYYILKVDSNSFRLCNAGIGGTNISNYNRKNYVRFYSTGSGYQNFSYPDISVSIQYTPVGFGTTTQQVQSLVTTPVVKGAIVDTYLYESGTGYGSTILNLEKKPLISIKNGREARLTPIIINGQINSVNIESSGNDYYSTPDLIVTDLTGSGSGADLRPVITNKKITDVKVISAGIGYSSSSTRIQVKSAGSGVVLDANIRDLTVNNNVKFGDEILRETENELQYLVCGYFNTLRESFNDDGSKVSNIVGWAYDGNPIYGSYGYSDPDDSNTIPKRLISGYILNSSNVIDRPSNFDDGFFVEDYQYTNSGDLDENNGRFGKTPEFPDGIYAYFSTVDSFLNPTFPYFIGNKYRSNTIKENSILNQKFNFNNSNLLRNTLPYKVSDDYAKNDFINEVDQITSQEAIVESVSEGFITSLDIVNSGSNYKVNDIFNFDDSGTSGGGLIARLSSIKGKDIVKIDTSVETYDNAIFTYENGKEVKVTIKP
ncbi:MAG: YHYH protein, partial [Minisyncoccia bacterium]